jgi:hypothetical protein
LILAIIICSCNQSPQSEIRKYIEDYTDEHSVVYVIFVSEFDCIECTDRIKKFVQSASLKGDKYVYGEFYKGKSSKSSNLIILEQLIKIEGIKWKEINDFKPFNLLSRITNEVSGPYVIRLQKNEPSEFFTL